MSQSLRIDATPHLRHLRDELSALSSVPQNANGRISWETTRLDEGTFTLISILKFKPQVDDHIKDAAIWHALNECARNKNFSTQFFIRILREFIITQLTKTPKNLVAVSQINCLY